MTNTARVVVFFNPDEMVVNNIRTYLDKVQKLFVVDNSNKSNEYLSPLFENENKIEYIPLGNNFGIAKALNIGITKADQMGYTWILTFSKDSYFDKNMMNELLQFANNAQKMLQTFSLFSPSHVKLYQKLD